MSEQKEQPTTEDAPPPEVEAHAQTPIAPVADRLPIPFPRVDIAALTCPPPPPAEINT